MKPKSRIGDLLYITTEAGLAYISDFIEEQDRPHKLVFFRNNVTWYLSEAFFEIFSKQHQNKYGDEYYPVKDR
jgi:hypothetical protein